MKKLLLLTIVLNISFLQAQTPCNNGMAGGFPCDGYTMQSHIEIIDMGGKNYSGSNPMEAQDSWGWTDPQDGKEYAIVCMNDGTAFVDISVPTAPRFLGRLESETGSSWWRDVKVYNNFAFIVSDSNGNHGMQVFDLTKLRNLTTSSGANASMRIFSEDNHMTWGTGNSRGRAHNIIINEDTGYAYILGSSTNSGAPLMVNIQNPLASLAYTSFPGSYCHDAQVVVYNGPDPDHQGKEILIGAFSGNDYIGIYDVTNKSSIQLLGTVTYPNKYYTHQGWFTEDQQFFIVGDEVDEENIGGGTRTFIFDLEDLDNPTLHHTYTSTTSTAIDHNGYVVGNRFYLANYNAGMRVMKVDGLYEEDVNGNATPSFTEDSYFDTNPSTNAPTFYGAWNVYPFFESGNIIISDLLEGLIIVKDPNFDNVDPVAICQSYTATLDPVTGSVTISGADLDGGSTDNFGIVKYTIEGQNTFTCADVGNTFNLNLIVEDDYGNSSSCIAAVTIEAATATFDAGSWDVTPSLGTKALFSDNYNTASFGNIDACSCEVSPGSIVIINAGDYIKVEGDVKVDGTLTIEHEGSLVQVDDNAIVTNNGTIEVLKTTPPLPHNMFSILGSPMSGEKRDGVFANSNVVMNHITSNFVPNNDVASQDPSADNFADDNGDNWSFYTGSENILPGVGYLVGPPTGGGEIDVTHTQGTLNNGLIPFAAIYNGTQNASPNILSNPYASAVDAYEFVDQNPLVDAIYYWEHITAPTNTYPGYRSENWDMGDISMYNLSGGVKAPNQSGNPNRPNNQYIASGQGFAVKANATGTITFNNSMRLTDNNTFYRNNEAIDRIFLKVENPTYNLQGGALIAFTEQATNGVDSQFDAKRLATPVSIYSIIDDHELAIQGRSEFNEKHIIPLGFRTMVEESQIYTISISSIEGDYLENATLYLKDNLLNTTTNLSETDYTFTANVSNQKDRFVLLFEQENLNNNTIIDSITIFPNPTNNKINFNSPYIVVNQIIIYDINGREVFSKKINNNNHQLDISNFNNSIYLIKIITANGSITKKIIKI